MEKLHRVWLGLYQVQVRVWWWLEQLGQVTTQRVPE
jgi:hypothetical protein